MSINIVIKEARIEKGLTQSQVAKEMGTTAQTYGQYETGRREPSVSKLIEIAKAIGVKPSTLMEKIEK